MGINPSDFRQYIVRPTLDKLGHWSPSLENLLLGSAAYATAMGARLCCSDGGMGIYGIGSELHHSVWDEFLAFDPDMASAVRGFASQRQFLCQPDVELVTNFAYATAIAWGVYAYHTAIIPENPNDIEALAQCWVTSFTQNGEQKSNAFVDAYHRIVDTSSSAKAA